MLLVDRLLGASSPRVRGRLAYRLLLNIVLLERPMPVRTLPSPRDGRPR